jgi:hypothetical protein
MESQWENLLKNLWGLGYFIGQLSLCSAKERCCMRIAAPNPHVLRKDFLAKWTAHFSENSQNRPEPRWDSPLEMPEKIRTALALSLAEYQLGDGGGPCRLIGLDVANTVRAFPEFQQLVDLWFREEKEHSRLLAGAVRRLGGRFVSATPAFHLFCAVRRLAGAQNEMLILLIVEIVSMGYYRMIRQHCGDPAIREMCSLIMRDESGHIAFHLDRLASPEGVAPTWLHRWLIHFLIECCATVLWLGQGKWLTTIGGCRASLWRTVHAGGARFLRQWSQQVAHRSAAKAMGKMRQTAVNAV